IGAELTQELTGTADGLSAAGVPTTVEDLIGWNAWMEMTEYWWPTVMNEHSHTARTGPRGSHCSGFIATGGATADGKIVIGHESFDDFWAGQHFNVILDITPDEGHRMVMQTVAGYFISMTDFLITSAGLAITETTIACFRGYDESKTPEYVRARRASQYAGSIDEWIELMNRDENGGYANTWMIGDINTGEIARYEEGLLNQKLDRTFDGVYTGSNVALDPRIRGLETYDSGFNDPRQHTGARRLRWMQLLDIHSGAITVDSGKLMLADTFDPYLGYENPSSRTICAHFDSDPMHFASDPHGVWNVPFVPAGSVDAKIAHADDIADMALWARFGRADGVPFDAAAFLRQHPLFSWQEEVLVSRPGRPWVRITTPSGSSTKNRGA
ncbi:MAG: C45 family autoproteolytic acyltransferase/hydrolase, partial [Mycetocola sp.]